MGTTHRLFRSIDDVDVAAWQDLASQHDNPLSTDREFISAMENGLGASCEFWHVIIYSEANQPLASASLGLMTLDLADIADPLLSKTIRAFPRLLSRFRNLKLLVCGLPISVAQVGVTIAIQADSASVFKELDCVVLDLAKAKKADAIAYKEFRERDLASTDPLLSLGYSRITSLPTHVLKADFPDFEHYCSALRSHYRKQITRSSRKLKAQGTEFVLIRDTETIARVYTPEVHQLYYQILSRAENRFETLPIEFFQELVNKMKGRIELIVLFHESNVIAFGWCLWVGKTYHLLFAGVNYDFNEKFDAYFNLFYKSIEVGLRGRAKEIAVGPTSDQFKARLGCVPEPMYAFVKGVSPIMRVLVRWSAGFLVAKSQPAPVNNVFRSVANE